MDYKTNWKDFLKYDENGRRVRDWPSIVVDTAPGEKNYMYKAEYEAMIAAEKAAKNAQRAARQAELTASRPESVNSQVTSLDSVSGRGPHASRFRASLPPASLPPDFERHSRKCAVCSHPDRDAIEGEFIRWRSPHKIVRDYALSDRATIYRHAHATNLFEERRRHVARVLESYLETIDDNPPEDFDPVTRAVRVYAHLNTHGDWFEPLRKVHITTSHVLSPNPHPESDLDLEIDDKPELDATEPIADPAAADQAARVEAPEFTRGEQRFSAAEMERCAPALTSGPAVSDRPSRASQEKPQAEEFRSAEGDSSTKTLIATSPEQKSSQSTPNTRHHKT